MCLAQIWVQKGPKGPFEAKFGLLLCLCASKCVKIGFKRKGGSGARSLPRGSGAFRLIFNFSLYITHLESIRSVGSKFPMGSFGSKRAQGEGGLERAQEGGQERGGGTVQIILQNAYW